MVIPFWQRGYYCPVSIVPAQKPGPLFTDRRVDPPAYEELQEQAEFHADEVSEPAEGVDIAPSSKHTRKTYHGVRRYYSVGSEDEQNSE